MPSGAWHQLRGNIIVERDANCLWITWQFALLVVPVRGASLLWREMPSFDKFLIVVLHCTPEYKLKKFTVKELVLYQSLEGWKAPCKQY